MRKLLVALLLLLGPIAPALAQVSVAIGIPGISIGINVPVYPRLVAVPGYPVYYAPGLRANYFFYDGLYWVFSDGDWYLSSWYAGPWQRAEPDAVPGVILRVPVRYYRYPPPYFRGWAPGAPPRWGEQWGHAWDERHRGWDRPGRRVVAAPAPLPRYQRAYAGPRYPSPERQRALATEHYRYRPRDPVVRQHFEGSSGRGTPMAPRERGGRGPAHERGPGRRGSERD